MTAATARPSGYPLWLTRRARWFLAAMNAPFVAECPVYTIVGLAGGASGSPVLVVPLGLAMGALQLRHSFAAARGQRPAGWRWTFLALAVCVYLPMYWFTWNWAATQILMIASAAMLLRGWLRVAAIAAPILGTSVTVLVVLWGNGPTAPVTFSAISWVVNLFLYSAALYGAVRLVKVADELYAARAEQAEGAIGQERLRVSRDLHDLLGQSLSAISLKGDLALRLLPLDAARARTEIESLTGVARSALHDVLAIARDEHSVSLRGEIDAAAALLTAAGIEVRIDADPCEPPAPAQEVLAWAVREGTTNVLRHSEARTCSITLGAADSGVCLEVANDGARQASSQGSGLAGLAGRAEAVSGSVRVEAAGDGAFRLRVWVPGEIA
jgi:two-component system, NarL family, sensor histidine kinase DesK